MKGLGFWLLFLVAVTTRPTGAQPLDAQSASAALEPEIRWHHFWQPLAAYRPPALSDAATRRLNVLPPSHPVVVLAGSIVKAMADETGTAYARALANVATISAERDRSLLRARFALLTARYREAATEYRDVLKAFGAEAPAAVILEAVHVLVTIDARLEAQALLRAHADDAQVTGAALRDAGIAAAGEDYALAEQLLQRALEQNDPAAPLGAAVVAMARGQARRAVTLLAAPSNLSPPDLVIAQYVLGSARAALMELPGAAEVLREATSGAQSLGLPGIRAVALVRLANVHELQVRFADAEEALRSAMEAAQGLPRIRAAVLADRSGLDVTRDRLAEARATMEAAVRLLEATTGTDSPDTTAARIRLADTIAQSGEGVAAQRLLEEARALSTRTGRPGTWIEATLSLAYIEADRLNWSATDRLAEAAARRALEIFGPLSRSLRRALMARAGAALALKRSEQAIELAEAARATLDPASRDSHSDAADSLMLAAEAEAAQGRTADALAKAQEALTIGRAVYGPKHPSSISLLVSMLNMGVLDVDATVLEELRSGLLTYERAFGEQSVRLAPLLLTLGAASATQAAANPEAYYLRVLDLFELRYGSRDRRLIDVLWRLAGHYTATSREFEAAERVATQAIAIAGEPRPGSVEATWVASFRLVRGLGFAERRRWPDAEEDFRHVLVWLEDARDAPAFQTLNVGYLLANALASQGKLPQFRALIRHLAPVASALERTIDPLAGVGSGGGEYLSLPAGYALPERARPWEDLPELAVDVGDSAGARLFWETILTAVAQLPETANREFRRARLLEAYSQLLGRMGLPKEYGLRRAEAERARRRATRLSLAESRRKG